MSTRAIVNSVRRYYNKRDTDRNELFEPHQHGPTTPHVVTFSYDDLPSGDTTYTDQRFFPANTIVHSARLEVLTAFAGGTDYQIGTEQQDGTPIDINGFFTAANLPLAAINVAGKRVTGSGAHIDVDLGTLDGYLLVTANGTFTAGVARLVFELYPLRTV